MTDDWWLMQGASKFQAIVLIPPLNKAMQTVPYLNLWKITEYLLIRVVMLNMLKVFPYHITETVMFIKMLAILWNIVKIFPWLCISQWWFPILYKSWSKIWYSGSQILGSFMLFCQVWIARRATRYNLTKPQTFPLEKPRGSVSGLRFPLVFWMSLYKD